MTGGVITPVRQGSVGFGLVLGTNSISKMRQLLLSGSLVQAVSCLPARLRIKFILNFVGVDGLELSQPVSDVLMVKDPVDESHDPGLM